MTEDTEIPEPPRAASGRTGWPAQLPIMIASAVLSIIVAVVVATGGRIVTSGESSAVLTSQVSSLLDELKQQRAENKEQTKTLQDLSLRIGELYTRQEARQDREAAERRFQGLQGDISNLTRRIEQLEYSNQLLTRMVTDHGGYAPSNPPNRSKVPTN